MTSTNGNSSAIPWANHSLSVLVPVINEVENLRPTVDRLMRALSVTVEDYEIIIVNDGSTDNTGDVAEALAAEFGQVRVIDNPTNMGLGYCYLQGIQQAAKGFFVYIPGDNTWPY